jgi:hypothetical protein
MTSSDEHARNDDDDDGAPFGLSPPRPSDDGRRDRRHDVTLEVADILASLESFRKKEVPVPSLRQEKRDENRAASGTQSNVEGRPPEEDDDDDDRPRRHPRLPREEEAVDDDEGERAREWVGQVREAAQRWVVAQREWIAERNNNNGISDEVMERCQRALSESQERVRTLERALLEETRQHRAAEKCLQDIVRRQQRQLMVWEEIAGNRRSLDAREARKSHAATKFEETRDSAQLTPPQHTTDPEMTSPLSTHSGPRMPSPTVSPRGEEQSPESRQELLASRSSKSSRRTRHRTRRLSADGTRTVEYSNGSRKDVHPDGTVVIRFANGDVETRRADAISYYYAKQGVLRVRTLDDDHGSQWTLNDDDEGSPTTVVTDTFHYPTGQHEHLCSDGRKMVTFPDGTFAEFTTTGTS